MRGVIIATGHSPALEGLIERRPSVMLPVAGKPFLHYVIESLVDAGVKQIDFILSYMPESVEESVGDGKRWGISVRFHLARDPEHPYGRLPVLGIGADELFLLAHGDRLPQASSQETAVLVHNGQWTGWARLNGSHLNGLNDSLDEAALFDRLPVPRREADLLLSVRTFEELQEANWALIEKRFPGVLLGAREAADGIWISRNVSLHPTAQLTAPVYIGENCRVDAGVKLGPRAVIGNDCLVDKTSSICESVVFAGSYVGQALELSHSIVDRNRMVNVQVGAAIKVDDNFILGSFVENNFGLMMRRLISRVAGVLLLILCLPLLVLGWLWSALTRSGPAICRKRVVQLPDPDGDYKTYTLVSFSEVHKGGLHELFLHFVPGLINVAAGNLKIVGLAPRSPEEIDKLPHDWKRLYLGSVGGLITEAYVVYGADPPEDLLYSAEVFYAAMSTLGHDARLILGFAARVLGLARHRAAPTPAESED
jgi:lipopolysaccharide/colanic/teichoic acid biosynthesis glycosyltransferase